MQTQHESRPTVWVFGDQLNRTIGALSTATPTSHRILIIESQQKLSSRPWHIQRAHFLITSMRRFADDLRREGFDVDYRIASGMRQGFLDHCAEFSPAEVTVTEPNSYTARQLVTSLGCTVVRSDQFLCHPTEFTDFIKGKKSFKMEDFYRWQRKRLNYLMDGDQPVTGKWNFDEDNRLPPPKSDHDRWATPELTPLDDIDQQVLADLPPNVWGQKPTGLWATTRAGALARLEYFIENLLPVFGEHEDAMLESNWHLAHSLLSPYLNNGLLMPGEVLNAAVTAFNAGKVPINSAEGFIRQILGWREYIWNFYWRYMPEYAERNHLGAIRNLPPLFTNPNATSMKCLGSVLRGVEQHSYSHHIERLMILGNFALIAGINPQQITTWMWNSYIDAAEWVMVPNVVGMSLYADGGVLATKPYASGGAYIDRMSNHCKGCAYDRKKRTGDDACPFTNLYWDFMLRHQETFVKNPRVARQVRAAQQLSDVGDVQATAQSIFLRLENGTL
jgi:deoxyribodipyrimidine photolyase-related protein